MFVPIGFIEAKIQWFMSSLREEITLTNTVRHHYIDGHLSSV